MCVIKDPTVVIIGTVSDDIATWIAQEEYDYAIYVQSYDNGPGKIGLVNDHLAFWVMGQQKIGVCQLSILRFGWIEVSVPRQ